MLFHAVALVVLLLLATAGSAAAATIHVTTTADVVASDGQCSLREAVTAANTDTPSGAASGECQAGSPGGNVIVLQAGTYGLSSGELDVSSPIILIGAGAAVTTINAKGLSRVLSVAAGGNLTVVGATLTGGHAPDGAPATSSAPTMDGASGGAIDSAGSLTLRDVRVEGNQAGKGGNGASPFVGAPGAQGNGGSGGGIESTGPLL